MIEKLIGVSSLKVVTILDSNGITRSFEPTESNLLVIKNKYPDLYNNINQIWDKQVFNDYKDIQKTILDNDPLPTTEITNSKSNTELEQELIATQDELAMTNAILGDTILSGWEMQGELDAKGQEIQVTGQILGDTILTTWEMDERLTEIEEYIGGNR